MVGEKILKHIPGTDVRRRHLADRATSQFFASGFSGAEIPVDNPADAREQLEEHIHLLGIGYDNDSAWELRERLEDALETGPIYKQRLLVLGIHPTNESVDVMYL